MSRLFPPAYRRRLPCGVSVAGLLVCLVINGCASFRIEDQSGHEAGIAYYLPKPYMLVTRNVAFGQQVTAPPEKKKEGDGKDPKAADPKPPAESKAPSYAIHLIYLPDLKKGERRMYFEPNWGSAEVATSLANGWQLTSANVKLDSKGAESLTGAAALLGAAAPAFTPTAATGTNEMDALVALITAAMPGVQPDPKMIQDAQTRLQELMKKLKPDARLFEIQFDEKQARVRFKEVPIKIGSTWGTSFFSK